METLPKNEETLTVPILLVQNHTEYGGISTSLKKCTSTMKVKAGGVPVRE